MGINVTKSDLGDVTVAGQALTRTREQLVDAAMDHAARATSFVPQARAKIREAAILKLRLEQNLSWSEIASHPDVRMTKNGVTAAYYRILNRFIEPSDIHAHVTKSLQRLDVLAERADEVYLDRKSRSGAKIDSIHASIHVEDEKAKLLGLHAPKRVEIKGSHAGVFGLLATAPPLTAAEIEAIQDLDPIIRPDGTEVYEVNDAEQEREADLREPNADEVRDAEKYIAENALRASEQEAKEHRVKPGVKVL